jgi:hypothetical protein
LKFLVSSKTPLAKDFSFQKKEKSMLHPQVKKDTRRKCGGKKREKKKSIEKEKESGFPDRSPVFVT